MKSYKRSIVVFSLLFGLTQGFTPKSECLIDFMLGEEGEYEGEGRFGGSEPWQGGYHGGQGQQHMDREDWMEMMGMDEHEGNEGGRPQFMGEGWPTPTASYGPRRRGFRDEDGEWEDAKRRRRRQVMGPYQMYGYRSRHTMNTLNGKLTCGVDAMIHLLNVTVGYSESRYCYPMAQGCQAGSDKAKQIIHCQGKTGSCDVTIRRHFMARCGQKMNFAKILYECIPVAKRINVCSNTNTDITGSVVITSPSYPKSVLQKTGGNGEIVSCECTLRAVSDSHFELEYLRTHMSGSGSTCDGDMLLLERPDPANQGRYLLEHELCGHNISKHIPIQDYILRVTFLGGAPLAGDKAGFIAKFQALTALGASEIFHVSCSGTPPGAGLAATAPAATTPKPISGSAYANRLLNWMKVNGKTLPPNFSPNNLPSNFFNMSREQLQDRMSRARAQSQRRVGDQNQYMGSVKTSSVESSEDMTVSSSPGVLSGVVASLASVIVIMGSLGAYIIYRRRAKKRLEQEEMARYGTAPYRPEDMYEDPVTSNHDHGEESSGGIFRGVLKKIQNRPLPDPQRRCSEPAAVVPRANRRVSEPAGPLMSNFSRLLGAGKAVFGSRSRADGENRSGSVYSIASEIPESPLESSRTTTAAVVHLDHAPPPPRTRPKRTKKAPPPPVNNKKANQQNQPITPVAPPRRRTRKDSTGQSEDVSPSPYDNAADNEEFPKVTAQLSSIPDVDSSIEDDEMNDTNNSSDESDVSDDSSGGSSASIGIYNGGYDDQFDEDETYTSINEIQMAIRASNDQDGTEI